MNSEEGKGDGRAGVHKKNTIIVASSTSYYDACQCHLCAKILFTHSLRDLNNVLTGSVLPSLDRVGETNKSWRKTLIFKTGLESRPAHQIWGKETG